MTEILTDEAARKRIVEALDDTLIVEAAAGTGKTTELVRRIVRVIETGRAEIHEIVCVTFTEKAAGELKLRLREALEHARQKNAAGTGQELSRLDAAIARLEEAHISTIHGFCADLLRERPVEARVDPLFAVLTEGQSRRLYSTAFDRWFQEQLSNPSDALQRSLSRPSFSGFGAEQDNEAGPVDRLRNAAWELIQWRDFQGEWEQPTFERDARVDALIEQLQRFGGLSDAPASQFDSLYLDTQLARQVRDEIDRVASVGSLDYDRVEARLIELSQNRKFQQARKGTGKTYKPDVLRDTVAGARADLQAELQSFELDANEDLAARLSRELRTCADRYEAAKAGAGSLDFLDLLLKARNLVRDNADVRGGFQARFKRLFVDEFQDTDPLQAEILMLLAADDPTVSDWRSVRPVPGKLFIVGDPKQSIYRFRRADVGLYREVFDLLEAAGAEPLNLCTSFRARPNIQGVVNAAFSSVMNGDVDAAQADYVPLRPSRDERSEQPSVVVLPVPRPYGKQRVANTSIEESLPDAVGAFIHWIINKSGWKVAERPSMPAETVGAFGFQPGEKEQEVPVQAKHICLLFRRFVSYERDVTEAYVRALEARGIEHLLVGGRSFHNRAEIETLRAALTAIEWPDDELSVFATLRGALFGIGDEQILEYRHLHGTLHPFRVPDQVSEGLRPISSALSLLQALHRRRNFVPVETTISRLLEATRAHVRFALEHGGDQVLANVLHVSDLARRYEADGGLSFRGFIEDLREQAESGQAGEAPILEEGSDGVRMMTVHKAKGLEFPVVILADMTAKLCPVNASRYVDQSKGICAIRLGGWAPSELNRHGLEELVREEAEGVRLAYVAATRARDLLVIPAVGDEEREGWLEPLNRAVFPDVARRRDQLQALGCPEFRSKDSVLMRPGGEPAHFGTVTPGLHAFADHSVVWWDPRVLALGAESPLGIRRSELITKDAPKEVVAAGLAEYRSWELTRETTIAAGSRPSIAVQTMTSWARNNPSQPTLAAPLASLIEIERDAGRRCGRRFGTLVHAVLSTVPLDGSGGVVEETAVFQGRILGAPGEEVESAARIVRRVLAHPLLERVRSAAAKGQCRREVPVAWRTSSGTLVEGVIDLAFQEESSWTIVDFKTEEVSSGVAATYQAQVGLYASALHGAGVSNVVAILMLV